MVALIDEVSNMAKIIRYSERKVTLGNALCLDAGNLPLDVDWLTVRDKIALMQCRCTLNRAVGLHSLHITLGFHPSEEHLSNSLMSQIAHQYMQLIGFGQQPYLIYRHFDTNHPHLHVVSTPIRSDGTRIVMHRIGKDRSLPAQKLIEERFHLRRSSPGQPSLRPALSLHANRSLKDFIETATKSVMERKKPTDLMQWRQFLRAYGIGVFERKKRNSPDSLSGICYGLMDQDGRSTSVVIAASRLCNQPTMRKLISLFEENRQKALSKQQDPVLLPDHSVNPSEEMGPLPNKRRSPVESLTFSSKVNHKRGYRDGIKRGKKIGGL